MGKINAEWHAKHVMPKNATVDQRIAWHREHAKHCACRGIPAKLQDEMERRAKESNKNKVLK